MGNGDEFVLFLPERGVNVRQVDCPTDFRLELVDLGAICPQASEGKLFLVCERCAQQDQPVDETLGKVATVQHKDVLVRLDEVSRHLLVMSSRG